MGMQMENLDRELAAFLTQKGVKAEAAWPAGRRKALSEPVVLASVEKAQFAPAGMGGYLGRRWDPERREWEELYGRKAEVCFLLDILAPPQAGMQACRAVLERMTGALHGGKPVGLEVRELSSDGAGFDDREGVLRLRCRLRCGGWLYAADEQDAQRFVDFTLKGDLRV